MTAALLVQIVGDAELAGDLLVADRVALRLIRDAGGVLAATAADIDVFEALARRLGHAKDLDDAERALERARVDGTSGSDLAISRYWPVAEAAYLLGLAVGLRIAGGGK